MKLSIQVQHETTPRVIELPEGPDTKSSSIPLWVLELLATESITSASVLK